MAISLIFASRRMAWDARRHIMPAFTVKALDFMANYGSRRILRLEMWKLHRQLVPMLGRRLSDELVGAVHLSLQEPVRAIVRQGLIARTEPKIVAAALLDAITIMAPRAAVAFATGLDEPDRAALLGLSDAQKKARTNPGPADWSKMRLRIARAIFDKYLF
jgi:hypothetical protein